MNSIEPGLTILVLQLWIPVHFVPEEFKALPLSEIWSVVFGSIDTLSDTTIELFSYALSLKELEEVVPEYWFCLTPSMPSKFNGVWFKGSIEIEETLFVSLNMADFGAALFLFVGGNFWCSRGMLNLKSGSTCHGFTCFRFCETLGSSHSTYNNKMKIVIIQICDQLYFVSTSQISFQIPSLRIKIKILLSINNLYNENCLKGS